MLSKQSEAELLVIAKNVLTSAISGAAYSSEKSNNPELEATGGCFVTYKTHGALRGCIGCFTSDDPLNKTVAEYARASALDDPRFMGNRITKDELGEVHIDISILTPLEKCEDPFGIEIGEHGIYIRSGNRSGCFLPQVAPEQGWGIDEFWGYCCAHKAGLSYDAWREGNVELFTFTAQVFEGKYDQIK